MKPEIIVMLTHNDVTVSNARECFRNAADLPVKYWGFKDVGLSTREMEQLVADFKDAGKTPVLEVVSFDEKDLLNAAALATACGVEYFTGGVFSEAVLGRVREAGMKYFPFCGSVGGSPIELTGSPEDVISDAVRLRGLGADGVDLVAYRFADGDPIQLAKLVEYQLGGQNLIIAGSINSADRIRRMQEIRPLGYTMGGALFEGAFVPGGSFRDNLERVVEIDATFWGGQS
ncbi:hypothetical protein [Sinomonas mesophila]|uniref:hypothetical protein n=1 Tax=Sinomonas mesophila TaxID=1531955 RepID=UPI00098637EF|nr:hypothetical protein [Sinomonas mesophila]